MAKYIGAVKHPDFGGLEVYETGNGARCYGVHEQVGQIPFQSKKAQSIIRGLVIAAGYGHQLSRPPSQLEIANFAPEKPEKPETPPEPLPETPPKHPTVSVKDNLPEAVPEKPGIVKRVKRFFDFEDEL